MWRKNTTKRAPEMARRGRAARLQDRHAAPALRSVRTTSDTQPLAEQTPARAPHNTACSDRILLIACGALAREILDIKAQNGLDHMDLTCLPANLHLYPEQIAPNVKAAVEQYRGQYAKIYVVYADCGTGGRLERACADLGVEMVPGPHCYAFFEGNDAFAQHAEAGEITAFYLTDFLVKQFDAFVWRPMGLDKHPELRDMVFGNYTKLVYQSQIKDPALLETAKTCANRMGLAFEHRHTGYGELETSLTRWATG